MMTFSEFMLSQLPGKFEYVVFLDGKELYAGKAKLYIDERGTVQLTQVSIIRYCAPKDCILTIQWRYNGSVYFNTSNAGPRRLLKGDKMCYKHVSRKDPEDYNFIAFLNKFKFKFWPPYKRVLGLIKRK